MEDHLHRPENTIFHLFQAIKGTSISQQKTTNTMASTEPILLADKNKPHAVCIPAPAQGHINPMLKLAKLLHSRGFHITFIHTEYNYRRLIRSRGPGALAGLPGFRFEAIPDGLPPSEDEDVTQDVPALCESTSKNCLAPVIDTIRKLNNAAAAASSTGGKEEEEIPPVSCIVTDGAMSFAVEAGEEFGIPVVLFWTMSACGFLGYTYYRRLVERGYTPLKDTSEIENGYLETPIDWIEGMKGITLKDLPAFIRTTDPNDIMLNFYISEVEKIPQGTAIVLNTFDALEHEAITALSSSTRQHRPPIYAIGPLHLLESHLVQDERLRSMGSNLWKEDQVCLDWLDGKDRASVVFVNFGSIAKMTTNQLIEFAFGLANSKKPFLWIIRRDIVSGDTAILPPEFVAETEERSMIANWCPQEQVLRHPAVGCFLTHCGWNSTLESISSGVPVICWPFFAEQPTNCWYSCTKWRIGMEIDNNVKRDQVEKVVRELMDGDKGKVMRDNAIEWKKKAQEATTPPLGSSYMNFNKVVDELNVFR